MHIDLTNAIVIELKEDGSIDVFSTSQSAVLVSDKRFGNGSNDEYQIVTKDEPEDLRQVVGDHVHLWPIEYRQTDEVVQQFYTGNVTPLRPRS